MEVALILLAALIFALVFFGATIGLRRSARKRTDRIASQLGLPTVDESELEVPSLPSDEELRSMGPPVITEPEPVEPEEESSLLSARLTKSRSLFQKIFGRSTVDAATWDELEESLLAADVGVARADDLLRALKEKSVGNIQDLQDALAAEIRASMLDADRSLQVAETGPTVWLFVGVNGVGKTTTIAKLARTQVDFGASVLLAAADTFRAAAGDQLSVWGERVGAEVIRGQQNADPASVVFDAIEAARARNADTVLVDTAGRLHTKKNLMEELAKLRRVIEKNPGMLTEVLMVLDATTGQNGLAQAREFAERIGITGVVLTKLDSSAKGGVIVAIEAELGVPVKLVGLGEGEHDLVSFDPDEFARSLVGL